MQDSSDSHVGSALGHQAQHVVFAFGQCQCGPVVGDSEQTSGSMAVPLSLIPMEGVDECFRATAIEQGRDDSTFGGGAGEGFDEFGQLGLG